MPRENPEAVRTSWREHETGRSRFFRLVWALAFAGVGLVTCFNVLFCFGGCWFTPGEVSM